MGRSPPLEGRPRSVRLVCPLRPRGSNGGPGPFQSGLGASEGVEPGPDEHRPDLALVETALDEVPVDAERAQGPATPRAVAEVLFDRCLAPGTGADLDPSSGLEAGVRKGVDVALAVIPLDVLVLAGLVRRLMHPGLAGLEHVLQRLAEELPVVEVIGSAVGAGDHDALHTLLLEHPPHAGEVVE